MNLEQARAALDSQTFLLGPFKRWMALRWFAKTNDLAAINALVEAVDAGGISAGPCRALIHSKSDPDSSDRLWEIWTSKRQGWLVDLLKV